MTLIIFMVFMVMLVGFMIIRNYMVKIVRKYLKIIF